MSADKVGRRDFLKKASALGAVVPVALSFEEQALVAHAQQPQGPPPDQFGGRRQAPPVPDVAGPMPMGKLGPYDVSRLIAGHNLVGWQAHARDLIYVSQLLRNYFTDDKVLETYQKYEEVGINTSFLRIETRSLALAKRYKQERGGKVQWIAQIVINEKDQTRDINLAAEAGAKIGYIRGLEGDRFFKSGQLDVIAKGIDAAKKAGLTIGLAVHSLDALVAAEKAGGLGAEFYLKTFNSAQYWSAGKAVPPDPNWKPAGVALVQPEYEPGAHDNIWETTPKATAEFFAKIDKPFIAYKVLAAGAIHPRDGFKYAFDKGADFVSVGMYDFQLKEDVNITKQLFLDKFPDRTRPWRA